MKRKRRWIFCSSVAIGSLFLSSLAVASLLPGGPDIFSAINRVGLKNPLESVLGGRSNQPWSELPGNISLPTNGGLFGSSGPWSEGLPGQVQQTTENFLLCQLVGDLGSLPLAIPSLPTSRCSSQNQIANLPITPTFPDTNSGATGGGTEITTIGTTGPNPYEVRQDLPGPPQRASEYDALTINPIVRQRDLSNLYDQTLSRSTAAPMVGKTGTKWMTTSVQDTGQVIQHSQKSAQAIGQLATASKSMSVTQSVMKNSAQMQDLTASMLLDQSILNGKVHASLLGVQQEQAMLLLNQANLSEGIDEMNRRERSDRLIEASAAARSPLYIPGLYATEQGAK
jgi:hypothetical protein